MVRVKLPKGLLAELPSQCELGVHEGTLPRERYHLDTQLSQVIDNSHATSKLAVISLYPLLFVLRLQKQTWKSQNRIYLERHTWYVMELLTLET